MAESDGMDKGEAVRLTSHDLEGYLAIPEGAEGVVLFAHGSGSSRDSPRNQRVAESLRKRGLGTLLFDLLTPQEGEDRRKVFDIDLLARRLVEATGWLDERLETAPSIGYFGASTGAAAALIAETAGPRSIGAVVSRGGRVNMAGHALPRVSAPTLLIVGERDPEVLDLNRQALEEMRCPKELVVIEGATHLFEEPGAMERVSARASDWFVEHLGAGKEV